MGFLHFQANCAVKSLARSSFYRWDDSPWRAASVSRKLTPSQDSKKGDIWMGNWVTLVTVSGHLCKTVT